MNSNPLQRYLTFLFLLAAFFSSGIASAQLSASLKLSKRQFVMGEPVLAVITVTNYSGGDLTFSVIGVTMAQFH
ncbi:MAG: hypothetical protein HC767_12520, partial [Akkermansiaceae bacterium]|nr:hypothetical protein [Akkermansiaceae bacterium]